MKTRLLIIIGIVAIVSSIGMMQFSSVSYDVEYCQDWCDVEELSKLGCNSQVIDFINRATNLFDEDFDNSIFYLNWIGLPDSISQEKFDECLDIIREKRVESLENTGLDSKGCPQFCSEKVADNVFSFCGGDGFYSEGYMFTNNSTHYFDHNECEWIQNEKPVPLDIASIEDGHIRLNPVNTCAGIDINRLTLDELNQRYPATFTTKSGKTYEIEFLNINDDDLKEMPIISELIRATHQIPFQLNGGISASKGLVEDPDWNDYREWYDQKKTEQFNLDEVRVRGFVYNTEYYGIGFSIC